MEVEGIYFSKKHPMYKDLDRPDMELNPPIDTSMASNSSKLSLSSGKKRARKTPNPNWPLQEYFYKGRLALVDFYKVQSIKVLENNYLNRNEVGYNNLSKDLREELEKKYETSEQLNNYSDYWLCSEFLDNTVVQIKVDENIRLKPIHVQNVDVRMQRTFVPSAVDLAYWVDDGKRTCSWSACAIARFQRLNDSLLVCPLVRPPHFDG